ncbi:integral membrane protein 2C [Lissotriton helveticus]
MVKIAFQQPAVGLKDATEEGDGAHSEILLPEGPEEEPPRPVQTRKSSLTGTCYLILGLIVVLLGLVFASMYLYRHYVISRSPRDGVFHCSVLYDDPINYPFVGRLELQEDVKIYIEDNYEQINVPVPLFGASNPVDIIHDFQKRLTAYHDIVLDKCYVIELNTSIVMLPRNFWELLVHMKKGSYLPQTYVIQEEMMVSEQVNDLKPLGSFIFNQCIGRETYRLKRRAPIRRINRRQAENCSHVRHFENTFVVETVICGNS